MVGVPARCTGLLEGASDALNLPPHPQPSEDALDLEGCHSTSEHLPKMPRAAAPRHAQRWLRASGERRAARWRM